MKRGMIIMLNGTSNTDTVTNLQSATLIATDAQLTHLDTGAAHIDITYVDSRIDNTELDTVLQSLRSYRTQLSGALHTAAQLDKLAPASQVPYLITLLNDPEPFVREAAARPLARLQGSSILPLLLCAMRACEQAGAPSRPLSYITAQIVRTHATQVEPMLNDMLNSTDSTTRQDAAWCYGFMNAETALSPLLRALRDSAPIVRIAAANALRSFDSPVAVAALCQALFDLAEDVRVAVAATLSQVATVDSVPALAHAQRDSSQAVRVFVNYALKRLNGSPKPIATAKPARLLSKLFARA